MNLLKSTLLAVVFVPLTVMAQDQNPVQTQILNIGASRTLRHVSLPRQDKVVQVVFVARQAGVRIHAIQLNFDNGGVVDATREVSLSDQDVLLEQNKIVTLTTPTAGLNGLNFMIESLGSSEASIDLVVLPIPKTTTSQSMPTGTLSPYAENSVVCVTSGFSSNTFRPIVRGDRRAIGFGLFGSNAACNAAIQSQQKGYICAVTQVGGVAVHKISTGKPIGDFAANDLESCLAIAENGSKDFLCTQGPLAGFHTLFDLKQNQVLDPTPRSKDDCFSEINRTRADQYRRQNNRPTKSSDRWWLNY